MRFPDALDALMNGKAAVMWREATPNVRISIDFDWLSGDEMHVVFCRDTKTGVEILRNFTNADIFAKDWRLGGAKQLEDKVDFVKLYIDIESKPEGERRHEV